MKFKSLLILCFILCFSCDKGEVEGSCTKTKEDFVNDSGWLLLESPNSNFLTDVSFLNNDFGVISGSDGLLYKTNTGGLCVESVEVGVSASFFTLFIINEDTYFTSRVGLYKTTDGGKTFNELGDFSSFSGGIFDMHFFNVNKGIICKGGSNLYKTENGGENWINIYSGYGSAQKLQFVSSTIGYLYGGSNFENVNFGEIHKTTDSGETWFKIESDSNISRASIRSLYFVNENIGYFANSLKELYVTQNGGLTWTFLTNSFDDDYISDLVFVNEDLGYVIGKRTIFKTEDGGETWVEDYKSSDSSIILSAITKTPNGSIYVVGNKGTILNKG